LSSDDNFLSRWSRRKHEAKRPADLDSSVRPDEGIAPAPQPVAPAPRTVAPAPRTVASASQLVTPAQAGAESSQPAPLPPIESLTPESDFTPFMQPDVDAEVKRQALKLLFQDPRFNVMDGLDVYIDDYTKSVPIPEGWLEKMEQVRHLGIFRKEEVAAVGPVQEQEQPPEAAPAVAQKAPEERVVVATPSDTSSKQTRD